MRRDITRAKPTTKKRSQCSGECAHSAMLQILLVGAAADSQPLQESAAARDRVSTLLPAVFRRRGSLRSGANLQLKHNITFVAAYCLPIRKRVKTRLDKCGQVYRPRVTLRPSSFNRYSRRTIRIYLVKEVFLKEGFACNEIHKHVL